MKISIQKSNGPSFSAIDATLALAAMLIVVGMMYYLFNKTLAEIMDNRKSAETVNISPTGTTANIERLTDQDIKVESGEDATIDDEVIQGVDYANSAVEELGGVYNASEL